jgi:hypothetical protein
LGKKRTGVGEVGILLDGSLLGALEVLILDLDELDHLGIGV